MGALHHPRFRHLIGIEILLLSMSSIEKLKKLLLDHGEGDTCMVWSLVPASDSGWEWLAESHKINVPVLSSLEVTLTMVSLHGGPRNIRWHLYAYLPF